MRYVVIEYKGSHSVSRPDRDLISYEFSNDLDYLIDKYSLRKVSKHFDWQIEERLYHKGKDLGILLIDKEKINPNSPYMENIYPLLNSVIRDSKLSQLV